MLEVIPKLNTIRKMVTVIHTKNHQKHFNQGVIKEKGHDLREMIGKNNLFDASKLVDGEDENEKKCFSLVLQPYFDDDTYKILNYQNTTEFDKDVIHGMLINAEMAYAPKKKTSAKPRDGSVHNTFNATTHNQLFDKNTIVCIKKVPKLIHCRGVLSKQEQNGQKLLSYLHEKRSPKQVTDNTCKASGLPTEDKIRSAINDHNFTKDLGSNDCTIESVKISGE